MLKIPMDYPPREDELELALRLLGNEAPESVLTAGAVQAMLPPGEVLRLRTAMAQITVREELTNYVVDVVRATRTHDSVMVGAGPRATQALLLGSRARAALAGRDFVTPDDVKTLAEPVLGHRLVLRPEVEIEGATVPEVVSAVLGSVAVPR
jgi:MoxR-like ATPase